MRQTLSSVLIIIAAVLVVGVKVVAPKPGAPGAISPRSRRRCPAA